MESDLDKIANNIFSIIELIEIAGVTGKSLQLIRKKILDSGNDVLRLKGNSDKKVGD